MAVSQQVRTKGVPRRREGAAETAPQLSWSPRCTTRVCLCQGPCGMCLWTSCAEAERSGTEAPRPGITSPHNTYVGTGPVISQSVSRLRVKKCNTTGDLSRLLRQR